MKRSPRIVLAFGALAGLMLVLVIACAEEPTPVAAPAPELVATTAPTPVAGPTLEPTATNLPTATAAPKPRETATPPPTPTATPTPEPTATPEPTPTVVPTPEPTATPFPTPTTAPTPTPITTPVPTATAAPTPAPDYASDQLVISRELEFGYSIDVPEGWTKVHEGRYNRDSPWSLLRITSQSLPVDSNLDRFAESVRDRVEQDWWPTRSLFEVSAFEKRETDGRESYFIRYRVQESPQYCVVDVVELVTFVESLPGPAQGFRTRIWMCQHDVLRHGENRTDILNSFRIITRPAVYYTQFISVKGITIKAAQTVDPAAFYAASDMISPMLSGRQDIADCMADSGVELTIIPKDQYITTLPEFAFLKGRSTFDGRPFDSFLVRGIGGSKRMPLTATSEENLLGLRQNRYSHVALVTVHEFAHSIQNLCFTQDDHTDWNRFYDLALEENIFSGEYMMSNEREFFAVFSTAYFEVTDEIGTGAGRSTVEADYPDIFEFLENIYGGAVLPTEAKRRASR